MKTEHELEIERTRVGGLGGSDAAMICRVARNGFGGLSYTDKKRLAVMKGIVEYDALPQNDAMRCGHLFEEYIAETMNMKEQQEKLLEVKMTDKFKTFAHADFYFDLLKQVVELKFSNLPFNEVKNKYKEQLQWYYVMGADSVVLVHAQGTPDTYDEAVKNVNYMQIPRDEEIIKLLRYGVEIIAQNIEEFTFEELGVCSFEDEEMNALITELREKTQEVKTSTARIDEIKRILLEKIEREKIRTITGDGIRCTYMPSTTAKVFNKEKAFAQFPQLNSDEFMKEQKRKSSILVTIE